jgi:vacuolar protein sorting-associated protein 35
MRAFDEMRKLEMFFTAETREGSCSVVDLYELRRHAGNVLPRL